MKKQVTHVLGVPFDTVTLLEARDRVMGFLANGRPHMVCTPNPEIVMDAQADTELMQILKAADLVVPDGIGVVWASKFSEVRLQERVAGYDLVQKLLESIQNTEYSVYFFGAAPGVAAAAAKRMERKYPGLRVAGTHNGYFDAQEEKRLMHELAALRPSLLLVGLGAPKQEKWIYENMRLLHAGVCIGVGGSFDVMSGKVVRAPLWFRRMGLEWLHRLLKQPKRFLRMMRLPLFVLTVHKNRIFGK